MRYPLGLALTNAFFCYHEQIWLQICPSESKAAINRRYVDDTSLHFCTKHHTENVRNDLNRHHENIRFTYEIENWNSISFFGIKISRGKNKFMISVYLKQTFSRVLTNFGSFIPKSYKYNLLFITQVIQTLLKFWRVS